MNKTINGKDVIHKFINTERDEYDPLMTNCNNIIDHKIVCHMFLRSILFLQKFVGLLIYTIFKRFILDNKKNAVVLWLNM